MKSAFGVDHGHEEFTKLAVPGMLSRLGTKIGTKAMSGGIKVQNKGAAMQAMKKPGAGILGAKGTHALGEGHLQAGGAMHSLGQKMLAKPGLTGGLAAGGTGAAGLGVAGGLLGRRKQ